MSRRTPIDELLQEESSSDTPSRRRSSRIAAVVTRRASVNDDTPAPATKSKRLSVSEERSLENDDSKAQALLTPPKRAITRSASKSPSALSKIEEAKKDAPAMRTRRRASTTSMDEETEKKARTESPVLGKVTTRRRSLRSMSTSPTAEATTGNKKTSTPRKSTRAVSASPTPDLTKSAPPKLRGRRPSVTEKIIPLESIEETEPKTEEATEKSPDEEEKTEASTENLPIKKKKAAALKIQNLQTISEKISDESEADPVFEAPKEKDAEEKPKKEEESSVINRSLTEKTNNEEKTDNNEEECSVKNKSVKEISPIKAVGSDTIVENIKTAEKKTNERESTSLESPVSTSKTRYSLSLKTKNSPAASIESKKLKTDEEKEPITSPPRRSPRISTSDSGHHDKTKPLQGSTGEESEESFHLKLNLSQFDVSQESIEEQKTKGKTSMSTTAQENGMNTSGSSNTSDKENLPAVSKKEMVLVTENMNFEKRSSPRLAKVATPETSSNQQNPRKSRNSFYEPMDCEDFPSDYEYSILEKETGTPTKNTGEQFESPKSANKSKILDKSLPEKSSKILETSTENPKVLQISLEQLSPSKISKDTEKHKESSLTKASSNFSETEVLKVDLSEVKAYSLATELAKPSSPKRRSARLLDQSKSESPENVLNSSSKSAKRNIDEDLESSMEAHLNETTVSINEHDLEDKNSSSPIKSKELVGEQNKLNKSKEETSSMDCNSSPILNKSNRRKDQNKSIIVDQQKGEDKDDDSIFLDDSDSEDVTKKDQSKTNTSLRKSPRGKEQIRDDRDDNPKISEDSGSEDIMKKDQSKPNMSLRRSSRGKEQGGDDKDENPNISENSENEDIMKKDQSKPNMSLRRSSRGKEQGGDDKDDDPKFSESSESEDMKKDEGKPNMSLRRSSRGKEQGGDDKDDDPKFSESSESEDMKKDEGKPNMSLRRSSRGKEQGGDDKDDDPKFSESSESEDMKKDEGKPNMSLRRSSRGKEQGGDDKDDSPKFSESSESEDMMEDEGKPNMSLRRSSRGKEQGGDDKDDGPKFSESADMKKDEGKPNMSLRRSSRGKEQGGDGKDDNPKFSESSENEDIMKKDQSKTNMSLRKSPRGKEQGGDEKDDNPKILEDSGSEDMKKDEGKSLRRSSRRKSIIEQQSKSNGDNNDDNSDQQATSNEDEELKFSLDSDTDDITMNDHSRRDSMKSKPRGKNNSESDDEGKKDGDSSMGRKSRGKEQRKSITEDPKFSEDSDDEDIQEIKSPKGSAMKRKSLPNKSDEGKKDKSKRDSISDKTHEDPKFSEDSDDVEEIKSPKGSARRKSLPKKIDEMDSEESKKDSNIKRTSISDKNHEDPKFSEDSDDEDLSRKTQSKRNSKGKNQTKIDSDDDVNRLEDSDDDVRAPFLLYTVKAKKSVDSKPMKSSETNQKSKENPLIVLNSDSETEKDISDLDLKINSLIANQLDQDSESSNESVTHYLDDLAEEGEEDTPSEGSNDIIDRGESIGSTESEIDSDDTYENDSFIDDNEEACLLSGDEYDLGEEKKKKQPKKKHSRIITVSDSEEENKETMDKVDVEQPKVVETKEKVVNGIEEDSDLEKMSTQPYCGLTPPSVISVRESLSDSDKIELKDDKEDTTSSVLINKEDNLESLEELKQHEISTELSKPEKRKSLLTPEVTRIRRTTFTPNNSILEDESSEANKSARKRHSSITIQENIKLQDVAEGSVSDRISKVVDVFCSSVKLDANDYSGNIALNISLEYLNSPRSEGNEEQSVDEVEKEPLPSEVLNESKSKKKLKKQKLDQETIEIVDEKVLKKQLEVSNEPKPQKEIKLKKKKKEDELVISKDKKEEQNEAEEDWETISDEANLANKKWLSKKDRKKKRKQKKSSTETEEVEEIIPNDSDLSDDLDAKLNEKYSPNTSEELEDYEEEPELELIPKKSNKKKSKKQVESVDTEVVVVKKVKKRKRDKSINLDTVLIQEPEENIISPKKKKKDKSKPQIEVESTIILPKKSKKPKTSTESEVISDEVFLEETQEKKKKKKNKKTPVVEEIKPKIVETESTHIKKKKKKVQPIEAGPSSSKLLKEEESKFQYFPSRILNTLAKNEKTEKIPETSIQPKKPKLVPSSSMGKRSWSSDVVDSPLLPSKTSKKIKLDMVESFHSKDFKNLMLNDPSRVKRMDSKNLLKKKQKMKF